MAGGLRPPGAPCVGTPARDKPATPKWMPKTLRLDARRADASDSLLRVAKDEVSGRAFFCLAIFWW